MSESRTPGKRAACDRCRTQKLRCLRVEGQPTGYCIRCVRSKVECVTSSSKRPGRPAKNANNASRQHTESAPKTCSETITPLHITNIPLANIDDWFNLGPLDANHETSSACWNSVESGDMYSHDFPMSGSGSPFLMPTLPNPTNGNSNPASSNPVSISGLQHSTMKEHSPDLPSNQDHRRMLQPLNDQHQAPDYDHGLHLSSLHHDLSNQLFMLRSMPWDMVEVMRLTCIYDTNGDPANLESNPLASIAKTSAEFAELLWSLQTPLAGDAHDVTPESGPPSPTHSRLSIADHLTIVSCHALIISIYDSIFSHFIDQSLHDPSAVNVAMECAPKLFLGGIAVPTWPDMLGHLLFFLAESQLRPIERLLGLPHEFCVSLKRISGSKEEHDGLFSSQSGQSLFTTLMQFETERTMERPSGIGAISSLKEKIRRVQSLK